MEAIIGMYRRAFALVRDRPWLVFAVMLAEFVQHVAEIRLGMYSGNLEAGDSAVRLLFGGIKIFTIVIMLIIAWRLWSFAGDVGRSLKPTVALCRGIAAFILVQLLGDLAALGIGRGLIALAGEPAKTTQVALILAPLLLWWLVSVALFPWYVGLATEDRDMTLRRSFLATRGRWPATWGLLFAALLPLMVVHYAIGYAALHGAPAWPLMMIDAVVVGLLAAALAAAYYTIYQRASQRTYRASSNVAG